MVKKHLPLFIFLFVIASFLFVVSPQKAVAAVNHIVISQIQIAGVTATDEFVELYNPTGEVVDLSGYRLTKKVTSGTQSTLIASMSGVLSPNHYYLIKHPTGYGGSVVADTQYSTSSSVTADNVVVLYSDAGTTTVDTIGFGTPFDSETLPFNVSPTASQSLTRTNNVDTDNNSVDFELLQISAPRNSSTVSATPTLAPTSTPSETTTPIISPTSTPTPEETPPATETPTPTSNPTETPTLSPAPSSTPTPIAVTTPTPKRHNNQHKDDDDEIRLPFGFRCKVEKHEFEFQHHRFKYLRFHFHRR